MLPGNDAALVKPVVNKVANVDRSAERDRQVQHLIEVAIVEHAVPTDRQRIAAHHAGGGGRVVGLDELLHVAIVVVGSEQELEETADRHVRDRVERVEHDSVANEKLAPEIGFDRGLRRGQERAHRIVNQIQLQSGTFPAVAQTVEQAKRFDRFIEHALAALRIGIGGHEVGQAGDDLDLVLRQESSQVFLRRQQQDAQIAAVHHVPAEPL